jgi:hypothetical protein
MASDQPPNLVPLMLRGLSKRLLMVLVGSFRFGLVAGKGINLQVFLASLYKSFPAEVAPFFFGTEQLEKLVRELSSIDLSAHEIAPATNPGDPGMMLMSKMDERLVGLLSRTAEVTSGKGNAPADIAEFLKVLSNDAAALTLLRNELGLTIRSQPT